MPRHDKSIPHAPTPRRGGSLTLRATVLIGGGILLSPALPVHAQRAGIVVALKYVPTEAEEVLEKRGVVPVGGPPFEIATATDARPDHLDIIGRNIEKKAVANVFALSPVASWVTQVLETSFRDWGTPSAPGSELVLVPEILKLFVVEEHTYKAEVTIKFRLQRRDGTEIWAGVVGGAASRFGRSLKEENYQEVLSDALLSCISKFWVDASFRDAWARGTPPRPAGSTDEKPIPSETLTPEATKEKLLQLREAGFDDEMLATWVRRVRFSRELMAEDLIDWKAAGIPQAVVKAALE